MFRQFFDRLPQRKPDGTYHTFYIYRRIFAYIRRYWLRALFSVLVTFPIGSLDAAIAFSLKPYMDGVLVTKSLDTASFLPLVIVGLTSLQGVCTYLSIYLNGWLGSHITRDIRQDLFQKLQTMEVRYFDQNSSGFIIQRYYNDPEYVQTHLFTTTKEFLTRLFSSISLMTLLVYTSWKLAIIAILSILCILFPLTMIRQIIKSISAKITGVSSDFLSFYTETSQGIRVIYGYNLPQIRYQQFRDFQTHMLQASKKLFKSQGWLTPSMHIIASCGVAIIIFFGTQLVAKGEMTGGAFVSFFVALIMLYNPVKSLGNTVITTHGALLSAGRIIELLDLPEGIQDKPDAKVLTGVKQGIEFSSVWFEYLPGKPVLKDISLTLKKGETVAIVGNSGGGKTTLTNLICRFYDVTEGAILIDGVDIRDYTMASLRSQISLVMQDNFLFNRTIRENLLYGNPSATEAQIYEAVEKAYLTTFIQSLPAGLDTQIGERGILLSGGQRQRVAIARALLKNAPIVVLDEATSALDNQSEAMVQKAIESLMADRTVIIIAHRLSTIRHAHRIVVLNEGQIAEEGTHEDLLALDEVYANLYNTQFKTQKDIAELPEDLVAAV